MNLAPEAADMPIPYDPPKILIVDDEPRMCDSLKALLSAEGYEIHTCTSGKDAIERLTKNRVDLVLLDIVMPEIDGHRVMQYINSQDTETLVIFITGHASVESAIEALRGRAYGYLRKPFEYEELAKAVKNALDQQALRSERKRVEEALRKARGELEARVKARTAELTRTNELLQQEITERKRAEEALRESEKRYKELWDEAPIAYHTLDTRGIITRVNQTEAEMLGRTREEMVGKPIFDFILPEQRKEAEERFRLKLAGKHVPKHHNRIYVKKDGAKIHVSLDDVLERGRDGKVSGVRTTMVDVTERKRAEEALQGSEQTLRHLSSQLLEVQENEKKRISRELHDSIGQVLASVKIGLEDTVRNIRRGMADESVECLEALISAVHLSIKEVRRIHADLRPPLLDDLGIIPTIAWFCREFEKLYSGIRIEKEINIEEKQVPEPLKIVIFRVLQEALNNASKHAKANLVRVCLKRTAGRIELVIEDNGRGFDMERARSQEFPNRGSGLTSMKERTELLGGAFSIQSVKGAGTTVRAAWQCGIK